MRLFHNKVRHRKRSSFLLNVVLLHLLVFVVLGVEGEITSFSFSASKTSLLSSSSSALKFGAFIVIYAGFPYFASTKSIRKGKVVEVPPEFFMTQSFPPSNLFSSRSLQFPDNATTSEEFSSDSSSSDSSKIGLVKEFRKSRNKGKRRNRLSRQMGLAQEIAMVAPVLQTMGCIPKFFCGMNSKPPTEGSSALNDLAYLIKFAMLDDDDVEEGDPIFSKPLNNKGKDGLQGNKKRRRPVEKVKDDLIIENLAEEELIQEDPANLPFVWTDMENRIKTKPGNKERFDDELMDAIIVQPEQSSVGALFTGIKSALRIGRSVGSLLHLNTSQVSPRSMNGGRGGRRWRMRLKKPFWRTPQFRQEMELAHRIGKTEKDDGKCSSTFNVCPYTVHEMMEIVHGGYRKRKKKKKPEWYLNAQGPPESSEEDTSEKPFKDPQNLITTTTEKTQFLQSDPESQMYYMLFPHKALEKGITTVPTTTRKPATSNKESPENGYISPTRKRPQFGIQQHVQYDDESSKEPRPEHVDLLINKNKRRRPPHPPWKNQPNGPHPPHGRIPPPNTSENNEELSSSEAGKKKRKPIRKPGDNDSPEDDESSEESPQRDEGSPQPQRPQPPRPPPKQSFLSLQPFFKIGSSQPKPLPIGLPRPKYTLGLKQKKQQKVSNAKPSAPPQNNEQEKTDDKSNEASEEDEGDDEESQENSSEENKTKNVNGVSSQPPTAQGAVLHGRPSEEINEPPNKERRNPPSSVEDDLGDSEEEQNSNSAPSNEQDLISMELAKIPRPARPPHFRMNNSNDYSDEMNARPPQHRPINYSYFKNRPPNEQNGGPPPPTPPGPGTPETHPTSTQKYSTGLLSFFFGKKKKDQKQKPGNFENRPRPPQQNSGEDDGDEDDMDDDDEGSEEEDEEKKQNRPQQFTAPDGKYEIGHLGPRPSPYTPDFKPPMRPQRPYKGSTSMEDSDEKRVRSPQYKSTSPPPPTTQQVPSFQLKVAELPGLGPIVYVSKPHRIDIPPPATPPPFIPSPPPTTPASTTTTSKTKVKDSDEDDADSEEQKQSEESKEESSEEQDRRKPPSKSSTKLGAPTDNKENAVNIPPPPPIANYKPNLHSPQTKLQNSNPQNVSPTKTRNEQNNDSNQSNDSTEDAKDTNSDEGSDEASSEEEKKKKKPRRPPPPPRKMKPEDDELDSRPALPPLPPIGGEIAILGTPVVENHDDEADGADEDIPAPPPLLQGFATSLEILVPTKAPVVPMNKIIGHKPAATSQAVSRPETTGTRNPSEQLQGVRNPGSSSNRGPNSNNGGNKRQQQQPNNGDDKKKENSSEEKSSEEKKEKSSEESEEEEEEVIKGVMAGFDSVVVGSDDPHHQNADSPGNNPSHPPPVFSGSAAQKIQLQNSKPFIPRPAPQTFHRPQVLRNELHHHKQKPQAQPQKRPPFSMSNLLRPLIGRPLYQKKPLDPKVVEWIRESYGIPDLNNKNKRPHLQQPNRSGLQSQDVKDKETPKEDKKDAKKTSSSEKNKSSEKSTKNEPSEKHLSKNKSAEKLILRNKSAEKISAKSSEITRKVVKSDYITDEMESLMAQSLFDSSEEDGEEETSEEENSKEKKPKPSSKPKKSNSTEKKAGPEIEAKPKSSEVIKKSQASSVEKGWKTRPGSLSSSREKESNKKATSSETKKSSSSESSKKQKPTSSESKRSSSESSKVKSKTSLKPIQIKPTMSSIIISVKSKSARNGSTKASHASKGVLHRLPPIYGKHRHG